MPLLLFVINRLDLILFKSYTKFKMEKSKLPRFRFAQTQIKLSTIPTFIESTNPIIQPPKTLNKKLEIPKPTVIKHRRIERNRKSPKRLPLRKISSAETNINKPGSTISKNNQVTQYEILQNHHTELQLKFSELSDKYANITQQIEDIRNAKQLLEVKTNECNNKNDRIQELNLELEAAHRNQETALRTLTELQQAFYSVTERLESIQSQLTTTKKYYKQLQNTFEQLRTENVEKMQQIELNREEIQQLRSYLVTSDLSRRKLHDTIQNLKGNIRVFCRIRPSLPYESKQKLVDFNYVNQYSMEVINDSMKSVTGLTRSLKQEFTFDYIFTPQSSQEHIFEELQQIVQSALDGYNVCVFAYGQTGSGKTFTMEGNCNQLGMIPRTIDFIFEQIKQLETLNRSFEIKASFLEIYNEQILDLLTSNVKKNINHEIRRVNTTTNDIYVSNLKTELIRNGDELKSLLQKAQKNRAVAATEMNDRSSRSHAVTKIEITCRNNRGEVCVSYLNLVDLAGSEKPKSSNVTRVNETKNINKSLSCLSNVILSLHQKNEHIPYRNSKLTHLLMPSLGGNSKTLMIVNVSPLSDCLNETLNSLRFASKVKECKIGAVKRNKVFEECT